MMAIATTAGCGGNNPKRLAKEMYDLALEIQNVEKYTEDLDLENEKDGQQGWRFGVFLAIERSGPKYPGFDPDDEE